MGMKDNPSKASCLCNQLTLHFFSLRRKLACGLGLKPFFPAKTTSVISALHIKTSVAASVTDRAFSHGLADICLVFIAQLLKG